MIDSNAGDYRLQARMLATMCMFKLRAFVQDLGGRILDGPPGVVQARLPAGGKSVPAWNMPGCESWSGVGTSSRKGTKPAASGLDLNMELRVARRDPSQPENLTIWLHLCADKTDYAIPRRELQEHYEKIYRDLKAYLQSNTTSPGDFVPRSY